jgi:autotransporter-associated beta strand protein
VALAGNATIGGTNRMDFGQISPGSGVVSSGGNNYSLTVVGTAYREWDNVAFDANFGNINVMTTGGGSVGIKGTTTLGNPTNTLSVFSNATVTLYEDSGSGDTVTLNKMVLLYGGATLANGGSANVILSPVVLGLAAGDVCTNNIGGTSLAISNVVSGPGSLVKTGSSPLYLTSVNTYTGNTTVSGGSLALAGAGTIATSPTITVAAGATLDVSARVDGALTLAGGQTLQSGGAINGSLITGAGSAVSPGTSAATGTLTVSTNATLGGNAVFKLNSPTNDALNVAGSLTYGGTLTLTNISATALSATNSFKLFGAANYSGTFSSIVTEPPLAAGLGWNTNNLTVNGTISVVTTAKPIPHITKIGLSGTTLSLMATNGAMGGTFVLLGSTNLAVPINQWTPVLTNSFDGSGNLNLSTNILNPNNGQEFYILSQ